MSRSRRVLVVLATSLLFVALVSLPRPASAFTQSGFGFGLGFGDVVPMGHEWITRLAAIELLGYAPGGVPDCTPNVRWCDPNDPRKTWTQGLAKNLDISSPGAQRVVAGIKSTPWNDSQYRSRYKAVYDVIIGQRWVDIAGYNALTSQGCFNSVAQEAVDVQYDHSMRRWDESGSASGVTAMKSSRDRFIDYFVKAAIAPPAVISVYDGGAIGSISVEVDRNFFLFGRATHLFQDSFSPEHTVRIPADNHVKVRQVLSYACALGTEQHTHSKTAVIDYTSGDVIWRADTALPAALAVATLGKTDKDWSSYKASNMKIVPLVATEASKDLWAAIIRTMGAAVADRERVARAEATTLANNWLSFDEQEMRTWYDNAANRGPTYVANAEGVKKCMAALKVGTDDPAVRARQLVTDRRKCLYNAIPWAGYSDLADTSMNIWFSWQWRNKVRLEEPEPRTWQPPQLPADTGTRVRFRSVENGQYLGGKIGPEEWVYCRASDPPIDFTMVGPKNNATFRATFDPNLFLSYTAVTGAMKLHKHPAAIIDPTNYNIVPASGNWALHRVARPIYWMWLSGESPYISYSGDPKKRHSQWVIEGLR